MPSLPRLCAGFQRRSPGRAIHGGLGVAAKRGALPALALCAMLAGCSPRYDWRTVQSGDGGYAALYPARPTATAREVAIAGRQFPMTMQAARVDDTLFAVGVVTLPSADPMLREQALVAMRQGLAANLGSQLQQSARVRPVAVRSASTPPATLEGVEVHVEGVSEQDGTPRRMTAWLVGTGNRVYQAVVLEAGAAAADARQAEQVEQFLAGFHPY